MFARPPREAVPKKLGFRNRGNARARRPDLARHGWWRSLGLMTTCKSCGEPTRFPTPEPVYFTDAAGVRYRVLDAIMRDGSMVVANPPAA